eukprot:scaffold8828_cov204-Amphora_coffeaeformis.AAC.35
MDYPHLFVYLYVIDHSLSFVTEQVAMHTNGTIGGLLNATFGNAPELLIATAALRSGYYRVVQLAMLGSMLTNMLLVFGIACAIGGARWQVQELRTTSGNANVVMLYVAVAGCLFPAALRLSGQYSNSAGLADAHGVIDGEAMHISPQEVTFCRVNAFVLFVLYLCFLTFQLGTHRDEFADDDVNRPSSKRNRRFARRNESCQWFAQYWCRRAGVVANVATATTNNTNTSSSKEATVERLPFLTTSTHEHGDDDLNAGGGAGATTPDSLNGIIASDGDEEDGIASFGGSMTHNSISHNSFDSGPNQLLSQRRKGGRRSEDTDKANNTTAVAPSSNHINNNNNNINIDKGTVDVIRKSNSKRSDLWETLSDADTMGSGGIRDTTNHSDDEAEETPLLSMRMGIVWLFILTLCISSMSDILVDTIDDFALSMRLSEVFTSMVVIPFFSNVAEQVSAFIFAYRNEMDLCVAVTIGSAVQIATFVLPGSVLIGMTLDRSMTLYFGAYETCCLFFSVIVVGAVLQSGTSNWLTGAMLVGTYLIFASGVWFHELEQLTVDEEVQNWEQSNGEY